MGLWLEYLEVFLGDLLDLPESGVSSIFHDFLELPVLERLDPELETESGVFFIKSMLGIWSSGPYVPEPVTQLSLP